MPPGSVALAGPFSGVYPRESPGGWQLVGRTPLAVFDLSREPAALLRPGRAGALRRGAAVTRALEVVRPGPLTTVQDAGRPGQAALGVGRSGACDRRALALANRLVGNPPGAAALEVTFGGLEVRAHGDLLVATAGARCAGRGRTPPRPGCATARSCGSARRSPACGRTSPCAAVSTSSPSSARARPTCSPGSGRRSSRPVTCCPSDPRPDRCRSSTSRRSRSRPAARSCSPCCPARGATGSTTTPGRSSSRRRGR